MEAQRLIVLNRSMQEVQTKKTLQNWMEMNSITSSIEYVCHFVHNGPSLQGTLWCQDTIGMGWVGCSYFTIFFATRLTGCFGTSGAEMPAILVKEELQENELLMICYYATTQNSMAKLHPSTITFMYPEALSWQNACAHQAWCLRCWWQKGQKRMHY